MKCAGKKQRLDETDRGPARERAQKSACGPHIKQNRKENGNSSVHRGRQAAATAEQLHSLKLGQRGSSRHLNPC